MKTTFVWTALICSLALFGPAGTLQADIVVKFDKPEYIVSSAGEAFDVQVMIDADSATTQLEAVPEGLFSFGTQINFDSTKATVSGPVDIVEPLDFFSFNSGGFTDVGLGLAAGKGNIDQNQFPSVPYDGTTLMSVTLQNQASPVDSYNLTMDFYRTLGDEESLFIDGQGTILDSQILFGTARVSVVPEPSSLWACCIFLIGFIVYRGRYMLR